MDPAPAGSRLPADLVEAVLARSEELWEAFRLHRGAHFHPFVPADGRAGAIALATVRPEADSFVELGSGVGTISVLAALSGFDCSAIELDPWLHEAGIGLAEEFDAEVTSVCGTFVPSDYSAPELESSDFHTVTDGSDAWDELGCALDDFDLVYAFPWPEEEAMLFDLLRKRAGPQALVMTYGGTEGFRVFGHGGRGEPRWLA